MISTVVFDIGNVLMGFRHEVYLENIYEDILVRDKVEKAIWKSGYWNDLDLGMDTEEVLSHMIDAEPDYAEEIREAFYGIDRGIEGKDYAIPWIQELKGRGLQVLYLSNYSPHVMESRPDVLDFIDFLDGGIFSYRVGLVKPDPAIYLKLFDTYQLDPHTCLFIDDREDNLQTAQELGMHTLLFTSYEESKKKAAAILDRDPDLA